MVQKTAVLGAVLLGAFSAYAQDEVVPAGLIDRAAPENWVLWRCGPLPFPDVMEPRVPEAGLESIIDLGQRGADLTIVTPEASGDAYDARAFRAMLRLVREKTPRAAVVSPVELTPELRQRHLLLLGPIADNALAKSILGEHASDFMAGISPGGYRLRTVDNSFRADRKAIVALGADLRGAWAVAGVLAFAIHPERDRLDPLTPWPVSLPAGTHWAAFDATCRSGGDTETLPPVPSPAPHAPAIPFGVRIWGSPMPTLGSFQRLVRALRPLGINTIAIQGGGWPDLPDAADRYRTAVELAWREGIFTIIYVGNEMAAHRPSPLTANHCAIVEATKDLPGLLEWHLYNQLTADLKPAERRMLEEQMRWLTSVSKKPVGVEVVWGHDTAAIPADKVRLIEDLKGWGMRVVAHDDAPFGGWSKKHAPAIWEPRLLNLRRFELPMEAVIQAHVPFVEPTIPTAAQVRSQFWWAAAGGAKGFLFEAAYLYTHLSMRGLLTWDLQPEPDGRFDEIRQLAAVARQLEPVLVASEPRPDSELSSLGLVVRGENKIALRLRRGTGGARYVLLINPDLAASATARLTAPANVRLQEIAPRMASEAKPATEIDVVLPPGGGACFRWQAEAER